MEITVRGDKTGLGQRPFNFLFYQASSKLARREVRMLFSIYNLQNEKFAKCSVTISKGWYISEGFRTWSFWVKAAKEKNLNFPPRHPLEYFPKTHAAH